MLKNNSQVFPALCMLFILSFLQLAENNDIKVNITNLRNDKGHILISLFKDGIGYPDKPDKALKRGKVSINNKTAIMIFKGLPPGNYAIAILHDENDDLKMNTNFFGIPKEGYGFSNNVMGTFGPPGYSKAKFIHRVGSNTMIQIKSRY